MSMNFGPEAQSDFEKWLEQERKQQSLLKQLDAEKRRAHHSQNLAKNQSKGNNPTFKNASFKSSKR